jgi:hypothetical protein
MCLFFNESTGYMEHAKRVETYGQDECIFVLFQFFRCFCIASKVI